SLGNNRRRPNATTRLNEQYLRLAIHVPSSGTMATTDRPGARIDHHQNGEAIKKNRCSQPIVCTSSIRPLLRYSLRASATCVDDTVLLPKIERGSTTP